MGWIFKRLIWLIAIMAVLGIVVTTLQVALLKVQNPRSTAWMRMRAREAKHDNKPLEIKQTWVSLTEIPKVVQLAVVAAEDDRFYAHSGFDWEAIRTALKHNEKNGKVKRGGSTITQQLAKNLFLSPSRSYLRKAREALITFNLELLLSKDRILELYLNVIEFGPGVFGIEEAAQYHYHVHARQLALDQACRLAAIIPSPRRYKVNGPYVARRAAIIRRIVGGPDEDQGQKSEMRNEKAEAENQVPTVIQ
ncbi:monofunctional biosynthetic peptidoglycan transglycosylase [candidate division KSB1 bacterium]|nr:monofunctional biosynthetic peptidoglycan transglycosylase [candidate division KSB1 bacterium]